MRPRVILKTHTGVRRPGVFSVLIVKCTSPTQSSHQDVVIRKLASEFQHLPKELLGGAKFGERGAAFHVVWMAKPHQLELLTSNLFWSWKGQVLYLLTPCDPRAPAECFLGLTLAEKLIYLKYYLEADGALLLGLAREIVERGTLSEAELARKEVLEPVLRHIWEEYLDLTTNITERVELRQKLQHLSYDVSTIRHKTFPHVLPLVDLGLIDRTESETEGIFVPKSEEGRLPLRTLVERFPSVKDLESTMRRGEHSRVIAELMCPRLREFSFQEDRERLMTMLVRNYRKLRESGTPTFPIRTLVDACYAQMLITYDIFVSRQDIEAILTDLQARYPRQVGFHVDRLGLPAYVVISESLVDTLSSGSDP